MACGPVGPFFICDLLLGADYGHVAAGVAGFFTVAKEEVATAGGTEVADENIFRAEAGGDELRAIGFAQVEEKILGRRLMAGGHLIQPLDGVGFVAGAKFVEEVGSIGKLGEEFGGDFGADFVAATADRWTDGGEKIFGIGAELFAEFADGFLGDTGESSLPAGVDGGDGAGLGIDEEDGDAVGGLRGKEKIFLVSDGGIAGTMIFWSFGERVDNGGMNLF